MHKKIPYSTPDYDEYKMEYASFFDSISTNRFESCICSKLPANFNSGLKADKYTSVLIEPLFVNFQNCNGIYAQRVFGRISPLYRNGKHPHYLFAIINEKFIDLSKLDSLKIKKLVAQSDFATIYSTVEQDSIYDLVKYGKVWSDESELAPFYVKNNQDLIYNAWDEK